MFLKTLNGIRSETRSFYTGSTLLPLVYIWQVNHTLPWRHSVSNHQPHDCLLSHLFRRRSKNTSKPRFTGLCAGNSPVTGEFPAQRPNDAEMFPFDDVIIESWRCDTHIFAILVGIIHVPVIALFTRYDPYLFYGGHGRINMFIGETQTVYPVISILHRCLPWHIAVLLITH